MKTITSSENPLIKTIRRLQRATGPRPKADLLLEGVKLAIEALESGIKIDQKLLGNLDRALNRPRSREKHAKRHYLHCVQTSSHTSTSFRTRAMLLS